jgi:hypothetical protein
MKRWKEDAIRRIRRSRKATVDLLSKLPSRELTRPRTQGEWAIKDVVSHFVAWEELAVQRLKLIRRGRADQLHYFQNIEEANRFNKSAVSRLKKLTLKQILKRAEEVAANLEKELKELPEDEWNNSTHRVPVYKWLPEFSWTHEAAHRKRIQKLASATRHKRQKSSQ